jgi:hypothetical protein
MNCCLKLLMIGGSLACAQSASAQTPEPQGAAAKAAFDAAVADKVKTQKTEEAAGKFGGLELGAGLSFTIDVGKRDRVTDAEVVNGIVRIKNADNSRARLMLESHYFFKPNAKLLGLDHQMWGIGPFVAIQGGSDNIIEAIGMGLMIGFRRLPTESKSFNLGVGFVVDPNVKVLGDGIVRDKPLPAGETEIRFKEDSQAGIMVLASFTF